MRFRFGPSRLGNLFVAVGLLLLLAVPASYAVTELQGMQLRNQLQSGAPPEGTRPALVAATSPPEGLRPPLPAATAISASPAIPTASAPARPGNGYLSQPTASPAATWRVQVTRTPTAAALRPKSRDLLTATPSATVTARPTAMATPTAAATLTPTATATPTVPSAPTPAPLGPPARIVFSDLKIAAGVTEMGWEEKKTASGTEYDWLVPENTAGWAISDAPLGVPGNVVLSGHNNIFGMVFRAISLAWPENNKQQVDAATYSSDILNGRLIELYAANGRRLDYRVTGFYRLHDSGVTLQQRQANASYMQQTPDQELTLITCWPPWSNTYRLIVRARLVQ